MKLQIRHKLFFTLLITSTLVAAGLFFYLQWSFDRGFLNYVRAQEIKALDRISEELALYYDEYGNWEFLQNNHYLWQVIHNTANRPFRRDHQKPEFGGHHPGKGGVGHPPIPPQSPGNMGPRIILYGPDKKRIIGGPTHKHLQASPLVKPIDLDGKAIGYLGLVPVSEISQAGDLLFIQGQTKNFAYVTFGMIILSLLLTFPVTSHLLKPIKELTMGTRKLIRGRYDSRISISTRDELGKLSQDFNTLAATLVKNEQARKQWVADISHELRTPLSVLRGEMEALLDGVRDLSKKNIESLHGEILQLEHLVNDLYELSMSDIGALTYKKIEVDLAGIVEEVKDLYEKRFEDKGIVLSFYHEVQMRCFLLADPNRLQQLFSNLLENSLRYTHAPGKLELTIKCNEKFIDVYCSDSEPGVEEHKLDRIFDRLYRVDPSRNRVEKGAGLGLSICYNIVDAHQGTIKAQSSPYGGLTIHIQFPKNQY